MPIPEPSEGEDQDIFHARCMRAVYDEYGQEQGNAICFSQWRRHHGEKSIDTGTGLVAYDLQGQRKKEASMIGGEKRLYGRIEKVDEMPDGTIKVHGIASTEDEDEQGEVVKADAMREAIPSYMQWGALREMHGLSAAGRALQCSCGNDNVTRIVAHVVDPVAVKKVQTRTYNGFSIGGRVVERAPANYKTITKLQLHEISLVDRPANPAAVIDLWKIGESGDKPMPDGNGLGTIGDLWADALAKVGPQIWDCGNPEHKHAKKDEAARCIMEKRGKPMRKQDDMAMGDGMMWSKDGSRWSKDGGMSWMDKNGMLWGHPDKQLPVDLSGTNVPTKDPDWIDNKPPGTKAARMSKDDMMMARRPFPNAAPPFNAKAGMPGGDAAKHGWPGEAPIRPGDPPGAPNSQSNFDGDMDEDDSGATSGSSAGHGHMPESDEDRMSDFGDMGKKGDKPKGDYGSVRYADPGYQGDKKPRYPIDSEKHVRAAWSYINQADNSRRYSSEQLGRVKAAIRSAAKEYGIEISEKAIFDLNDPEALLRALATASLDEILDQLPYDLDRTIEKAGRRMAMADNFMMNVAHDAIGKMTDQVWCMKADEGETPKHYTLGETYTQDTARNPEHAPPTESTDSGTAHYRLGENSTQDTERGVTAKRGMRHSTMTMGHLKKAHDALCRAGAACPAHEGMEMAMKAASSATEEGAMSATTDDDGAAVAHALRKAHKRERKLQDQIAELTTKMSNMSVHMEYLAKGKEGPPPVSQSVPERTKKKLEKALAERDERLARMEQTLEKIASQPVPGSASHLPPGIFDVTKSQDGRQGAALATAEMLKGFNDEQRLELEQFLKGLTSEQQQEWKFKRAWEMSKQNPYVQHR